MNGSIVAGCKGSIEEGMAMGSKLKMFVSLTVMFLTF